MIKFQPAEKSKCKLRMLLSGTTGSGKTFGALTLATGIGGKIVVIDSENGSSALYGREFKFDYYKIEPPYTPDKYVEAIEAAEKQYDIIIIDSLSHAWAGEGGILEIHESQSSRGGNSFAAWAKVNPIHNRLLKKITHPACHTIATMRKKTIHVQTIDSKGKTKITKMGMDLVQRKEMEYEFDLHLDLSNEDHMATVEKDRTRMFDGTCFQLNEGIGIKIKGWLEEGVEIEKIEFDIEKAKQDINACADMDSLKDIFGRYYHVATKLCELPQSQSILDEMIAAKNSMKAKLSILEEKHGGLDTTHEPANVQEIEKQPIVQSA